MAQDSIVNSKEVEHEDSYLLRRHVAPGRDILGGLNGKRCSDLFLPVPGLIICGVLQASSSFCVGQRSA